MQKPFKSRGIKVLRESVAKRIAAGEVIDRPLSVIRELLDNSIDSGASDITVYIEEGGLKRIRCLDNGCGMTAEDLKLCYLPHATSKINDVDDLYQLSTLGFRGEALSSIAACSRLTINGKTEEDKTAYSIYINNGKLVSFKEDKGERGVSVESVDLFYSIPARLQFLKSQTAEGNACKEIFVEKALPFPEISFRFFADNKLKIFLPASNLHERVINAFPFFTKELSYFEKMEFDDFSIEAVISSPSVYKKNRKDIKTYINNRRISEYVLLQAVEYGYSGYLPGGCFPAAFIFIKVKPDLADFNIHPAKKEARLKNLQEIRRGVIDTIRKALSSRERSVVSIPDNINKEAKQTEFGYENREQPFAEKPNSYASFSGPLKKNQINIVSKANRERFSQFVGETNNPKIFNPVTDGKIQYFGQIYGVFLLFLAGGTFYILDQHAAHEKILYEKLRKHKSEFQDLLTPLIFSVEKKVSFQLEAALAGFEEIGIKLEKINVDTWQITSLRSMLLDHEEKIINFIQEGLLDKTGLEKEFYANIACKSAIKDGDKIDNIQAEQLIRQALDLENPRCPHGRPIWFNLSKEELFRFVGRTI